MVNGACCILPWSIEYLTYFTLPTFKRIRGKDKDLTSHAEVMIYMNVPMSVKLCRISGQVQVEVRSMPRAKVIDVRSGLRLRRTNINKKPSPSY